MKLEIKAFTDMPGTTYYKVVDPNGVVYASLFWNTEYEIYIPDWDGANQKLTDRQWAWIESFRSHINKIAE